MVYLDYNATAPYSPKVRDYMRGEMAEDWANPSSGYDLGRRLFGKIREDRGVIADFLDCSTKNLFFTSGATESINSALSWENIKRLGVENIITSPLEHSATLAACDLLEKNGLGVFHVQHDGFGNVDLVFFENLCRERERSMVSILYVNNETGLYSPVKEMVGMAKKYGHVVHVDAVQALGKLAFSLDEIGADFVSFSGHKIGALKGIGLLYVENSDIYSPLIRGGEQERGRRGGTYNFAGIHSLRLAVEDIDFQKNGFVEKLRDGFEADFLKIDKGFEVNGFDAPRVFNTSNIHIPGFCSREIILRLAAEGIFVSTGSACRSGSVGPSHVIASIKGKRGGRFKLEGFSWPTNVKRGDRYSSTGY